jgi:hypothetical protein
MAIDSQMHFERGFNSVHKLECQLSSLSESQDSFHDWKLSVLERYWPKIGDAQVKSMALRCVSTLYHGAREIPMLLEHFKVPVRYMPMKQYQQWLVKEDVLFLFYIVA